MPASRTAPVLTTTKKVAIIRPMMVEKLRTSTCNQADGQGQECG